MNEQAPAPRDISVVVFCQNEAARIGACLSSIAAAGRGFRLGITVIANGSTDGSLARALATVHATRLPARLYAIAHGDKSNAINHSFYALRQSARLHVFIDGYAVIAPDAFSGFAAALSGNKHAVAATGVSGNGRTMKTATEETLRDGGRLHGQLHAFRPAFLDRLTQAGLRLPIGLYRGDGLLGSMACHDLAPLENPWDGHRIKGTVEATYEIPALSVFRPRDIARQMRRRVRQMRGRLENAALQGIIYSQGYAALPEYADDMITDWLAAGGQPQASLTEQPFMHAALRQVARRARPPASALQPVLVHDTS